MSSIGGISGRQPSDTRLKGGWLIFVRLAWFVVAGMGVGITILGLPQEFAQLVAVCNGVSCDSLQLTSQQAQALKQAGLSVEFYAIYAIVAGILPAVVYLIVAAVIFWRKPDDRMALLASFMLVTFGLAGSTDLQSISSILQLISVLFQALSNIFFPIFILTFPDGTFVPRWTRWLALVVIPMQVLAGFFPDNAILSAAPIVGSFIAIVIQVYRYRRVSNTVQRQQTKWVVLGITMALIGFSGLGFFFNPTAQQGSTTSPVATMILGTGETLFFLLIPISIGMAILRSRLYDIDLIIRRTLVYGVLTATLALVYWGGVAGLQELLRPFISEGNDLVIVITTLAVAALFIPLRRRIQSIIDRRFYRRKYDAVRTLESFSRSLRGEVDLDKLGGGLVEVVDQTMQPAHISLWLRAPGQASSDKRPVEARP